jgi:hypothetical protein
VKRFRWIGSKLVKVLKIKLNKITIYFIYQINVFLMNSKKQKSKKQNKIENSTEENANNNISEGELQKELEKYLKFTESELSFQNEKEENMKKSKRICDQKLEEFKKVKEENDTEQIFSFLVDTVRYI